MPPPLPYAPGHGQVTTTATVMEYVRLDPPPVETVLTVTDARDEVAIKVVLNFPDSWGRVVAEVDLTMPEMVPAVEVEVVEPEED